MHAVKSVFPTDMPGKSAHHTCRSLTCVGDHTVSIGTAYVAALSMLLGGPDEGGDGGLWRALQHAVPDAEDVMSLAARFGDVGDHRLANLRLVSKEDGRVDIAGQCRSECGRG